VTGYASEFVSCARLAEEVLAVRAGGRPSLLTGPLGKTLRDLPPNARGLVRGELPRDAYGGIARSSIGAAPRQVAVDLLAPPAVGTGFDLRLRGTFDSDADARQFAEGARGEVRQVVDALKELPLLLQIGGIATVRKAVEEIEVKADGPAVTVNASVSAQTLKALLGLLEASSASRPGGKPNAR
jgi:hypothetical protein